MADEKAETTIRIYKSTKEKLKEFREILSNYEVLSLNRFVQLLLWSLMNMELIRA